MARLKVILAIILLVGLGQCPRNLINCVVCKKTLTWSQQKQSKPASTYHEILSNFISPLDLDNSARVCSAFRIALTSAKSKRSAETFVDVSRHFQFPLFWNGKGTQILKKISLQISGTQILKKISLQISATGFEVRKSWVPKKVKNTITKENGNGIQRRHSNSRGDTIVVYMASGQHKLWADFKRAMWSGAIPPGLVWWSTWKDENAFKK